MTHVTVVVPTRDRRDLLLRAVGTALAQQAVEVQVVVVDDGSSDGSAGAVREQYGDAVTVVRNPGDGGPSAARNVGIAQATGDWIAFLDDDDVWAPGKLAAQLAAAELHGTDWVYCGMVSVDLSLRIVHGVRPEPPETLTRGLPIRNRMPGGPSNVVVRRDALVKTGAFDEAMRHHEDWDLWLRLAQTGRPALVVEPLLGYGLHTGNTSSGGQAMLGADLERIERRYAHLRGGRPVDRAFIQRWVASGYLRSGRRGAAARTLMDAARSAPLASVAKLGTALLSPRHGPATGFRGAPDAAWREAAEAWLGPLRAGLAGDG